MGSAVRASIAEFPDVRLVACVARSRAPEELPAGCVWMTPPELAARIPESAVVIDVSLAAGTATLLDCLERMPRALVSATTGLRDGDEARIRALAQRAPVIRAPNLSPGNAIACAMLRAAAHAARGVFEIDIVEHHHAAKRDAPSGTSLLWASLLAKGGGSVRFAPDVTQARAPGEVRVTSLRSGSVPGIHRAVFAGAGETLEIVHSVSDRTVFARGAIRAAGFLAGKAPGLYTLEQALESS